MEFFNRQSHSQTQQCDVMPIIPSPLSLTSSPVCVPGAGYTARHRCREQGSEILLLTSRAWDYYYHYYCSHSSTHESAIRVYSIQGPLCCFASMVCWRTHDLTAKKNTINQSMYSTAELVATSSTCRANTSLRALSAAATNRELLISQTMANGTRNSPDNLICRNCNTCIPARTRDSDSANIPSQILNQPEFE